jgi:hypothetical protein
LKGQEVVPVQIPTGRALLGASVSVLWFATISQLLGFLAAFCFAIAAVASLSGDRSARIYAVVWSLGLGLALRPAGRASSARANVRMGGKIR